MMGMIKKWWFYLLIPTIIVVAIAALPGGRDMKAYKDYIFYGIAQNSIGINGTNDRLKVNYTIKGFPYRRHSVYVEVVRPDGEIDFLYSEEHTKQHKAHYHPKAGLRKYIAFYKIPKKLPSGNYKLRVTFEFDTPGWGRLNRDELVSNDIKFEIKR